MKRMIAIAIGMFVLGCGGGGEAEAGGGHDEPHAGGEHHHGAHHGADHHHSSPAELRPLMNDLRGWLGDLKGALAAEDLAAAATSARAIATACDDAELEALDPAQFGPRFVEIDRELHDAAGSLADHAEGGDLEAARAGYRPVMNACVSCHAQAPTADVDLGDLVADDDD